MHINKCIFMVFITFAHRFFKQKYHILSILRHMWICIFYKKYLHYIWRNRLKSAFLTNMYKLYKLHKICIRYVNHIHLHIYFLSLIYIREKKYIKKYIRTYTYVYTCIYTYIYMCIYVYIHTYILLYICNL